MGLDKKRGVLLIILISIIASFVIVNAATTTLTDEQKIEKAFECLDGKVGSHCENITAFEDLAFTILATGDGACEDKLVAGSLNNECWPKSGCRLKETSIALIALRKLGQDTTKIQTWLESQSMSSSDLTWLLEVAIENHEAADCKINYDNRDYAVKIGADEKLSANAGNCLTLSNNNYFLKVKTECIGKIFTISCNKDFLTTLLYQRGTSSTLFVSDATHGASADGSTEEQVESRCFKQGTTCNYEGSLWAAFALNYIDSENDVSPYLPYLTALASENSVYFPETFLFMITSMNDYENSIVAKQNNKYWDISNSFSKYYDSALAMLALGDDNSAKTDAQSYFLGSQGKDGCWNNGNVRDTAFLLYSGWARDDGGSSDCLVQDLFCISEQDCTDVNGDIKDNFFCDAPDICCTKDIGEETCSDKGGQECGSDEICDQDTESASDTDDCCLGTCIVQGTCEEMGGQECTDTEQCSEDTITSDDVAECCRGTCEQTQACSDISGTCRTTCNSEEQEETDYTCTGSKVCCASLEIETCTDNNGVCRDSCNSNEESAYSDYDCLSSETCCVESSQSDCEAASGTCKSSCSSGEQAIDESCANSSDFCCKSSSFPWVWVIILIILIALVSLGILFRDKLRKLLFKKKSGYEESSPPSQSFPSSPFFPSSSSMPMFPRSAPVRRPAPSRTEREMQDTLRKLKDMSK